MSAVEFPRSAMQTLRHAEDVIVYLVAPSGNPNYGDEFNLRVWTPSSAV